MHDETDRRSFFSFCSLATVFLGAVFSAVIGAPIVCFVLDPRHRKGPMSAMKLVDGVKLDDLKPDSPVQGVVRDTRTDGWTLYPNDVIGRVWVVRIGPKPANPSVPLTPAQKKAYLEVFTTTCPHLGCFVNLNNAGNGFACPCHAATFNLNGTRATDANPAKRGMDTLEWEIDETDPEFNRIKVTYRKYEALSDKKIPLGGGAEETPNL